MEPEQRPNCNDHAPDDVTNFVDGQGNGGNQPAPHKEHPGDGKHGKKTSLRRSWRSASPLTRIQIIVGTIAAVAAIVYYSASFYQTRSNFVLEHRGYLVIDIPTIHTTTSALEVTVENPGHSIAEKVLVHANEATMNLNSLNGSVQNRMVNGWGEIPLSAIFPASGKTTFNIPLPGLDIERVKDAKQFIYVAIRVSYVDEVSGTKQSVPPVCMLSVPVEPARQVQWIRCDPTVVIPQMEKWDENESPKYRWPSIP